MNSGTNISRDLTIINIMGALAILWLAGSILIAADLERRDANNLIQSVAIQEELYEAHRALSTERMLFNQFNHETSRKFPLSNDKQLRSIAATDQLLDTVIAQLEYISEDEEYTKNILLSKTDIVKQKNRLSETKIQLGVYREYSLSQISLDEPTRDRQLIPVIYDKYTEMIQLLRQLASGVHYYPTQNFVNAENYTGILDELWVNHEQIMQMASHLLATQVSNTPPLTSTLNALVMNEVLLEQNWKTLEHRSNANGMDTQITTLIAEARNYYKNSFLLEGSMILTSATHAPDSALTAESWNETTRTLEQKNYDVQKISYNQIKQLSHDSLIRSHKNLWMDIVMVLIFVGVAAVSMSVVRRIKHQALHDSLTGLPNRLYLEDKLETLKRNSASSEARSAIIFVDLDRFKAINDNYGHNIGDELLRQVALRIRSASQATDFIARLGGDEFAILREACGSREAIDEFAVKLVDVLCDDFSIADTSLSVGASAGISIAPYDCSAGPQLLRNADIAMYHSKGNKLSKVDHFTIEMANKYQERLAIEQALKQCIVKNQLQLNYQPKVDCASGKIEGVEALLRWKHPEWGFVPPSNFISIAEDTGLMHSIGKWVINEAFNEIARFNAQTHSNLVVAVNITAQQFGDQSFLESVTDALNQSGLRSSNVELEVTESVLMNDIQRVNDMLKELKNTGLTVAIDDFGTGYSSLQYLQELELDVLKIDRAFILALDGVDPKNSVANSIVQLAGTLGLKTVAEGVETVEQDHKVRSLGVDLIQGYLYSKPVTISELANSISEIDKQLFPSESEYKKAA